MITKARTPTSFPVRVPDITKRVRCQDFYSMKLSEHNYFSEKIIKVKRINNAQRSKGAVREKITSVLKA